MLTRLCWLGGLTLSIAAAQSLTIVNPDFSAVAVQCGGGYAYQADPEGTCTSTFPQQDFNIETGIGWTFTRYNLGGPGVTNPSTGFNPPSFAGLPFSQAAILQNRGGIFQEVNGFVAGQVYKLTFYLGSRYNGGACCDGNQTVRATLDHRLIGIWKLVSFTPFTPQTVFFKTASGGPHVLGFEGRIQGTTATSSTAFFSGVSIEAAHFAQSATNVGGLSVSNRIAPAAPAQSPSFSFYNFGLSPNARTPIGNLIVNGSSGGQPVLIGTGSAGGTGTCVTGCGAIFSVIPPSTSGGAWTESVIYNFTGYPNDGQLPNGLASAPDGVIYGTAYEGGSTNSVDCGYGCGTVFELLPPSSPAGSWTEKTLYSFTGGNDGSNPIGLVVGKNGMLYGAAVTGGITGCHGSFYPTGCGTIFSLAPPSTPGAAWTFTVLHNFTGKDGAYPQGVVIGASPAGRPLLYGVTAFGGETDTGTVFSLAPPATSGAAWTQNVLYSFQGGADGTEPGGQLTIGSGGVLYGGTARGGDLTPNCGQGRTGCGTVFSLTPPSDPTAPWTHTVLHSFAGGDGYDPGAVNISSSGVLYGATAGGGPGGLSACNSTIGCGTIFSLAPPASAGASWTLSVLYGFYHSYGGGLSPGPFRPSGGLRFVNGLLYGAAEEGGSSGGGAIYAFHP